MKTVLVLLLVAAAGFGQIVFHDTDFAVEWDAVTTLMDGAPLPAGVVIEYHVYISEGTVATDLGVVVDPQIVIIPPQDNQAYSVGVITVMTEADTTVTESQAVWSSVGGTPDPWMIQYLLSAGQPPAAPINLRIQ